MAKTPFIDTVSENNETKTMILSPVKANFITLLKNIK